MVNTAPIQLSRNGFPRRLQQPQLVTTVRGVWQDNPAPTTKPPASPQPAPPKTENQIAQKKREITRPEEQLHGKKHDVQLNLWVRPGVKTELQRVAKREGLSVSAAGEALLENALRDDIHSQHGALLETIIEKAIRKHMRSYSNRLAVLLVRSLFTSEQTRSFVINILGRQTGVTQPILEIIRNGASNSARANITRITPQMKTLLEAVQKELDTEGTSSV